MPSLASPLEILRSLGGPDRAPTFYTLPATKDSTVARSSSFRVASPIHALVGIGWNAVEYEAQPSIAKDVDFGRLFGDECALPLVQDDDTTYELETLRDGGQVAE